MNDSNISEYLRLIATMMQKVANSTPPSWQGGVVIIRRSRKGVECEITNQEMSENIEVTEEFFLLCSEIANFKTSADWVSDWSEAKLPYVLGENPGDFSSMDGTYKYEEDAICHH
jgi:hypothetical protein